LKEKKWKTLKEANLHTLAGTLSDPTIYDLVDVSIDAALQ
jgi:hypothetical protein